ncbi:hypothetical protein ACHAXT_009820 [Thalassiosira profunda]
MKAFTAAFLLLAAASVSAEAQDDGAVNWLVPGNRRQTRSAARRPAKTADDARRARRAVLYQSGALGEHAKGPAAVEWGREGAAAVARKEAVRKQRAKFVREMSVAPTDPPVTPPPVTPAPVVPTPAPVPPTPVTPEPSTPEPSPQPSDKPTQHPGNSRTFGCIDDTDPTVKRGEYEYDFDLAFRNAQCLDDEDERYEYGAFYNVFEFSDCASACVNGIKPELKPTEAMLQNFRGFDWDCENNECRCLYDNGTLNDWLAMIFDDINIDEELVGEGAVFDGLDKDDWYCGNITQVVEIEAVAIAYSPAHPELRTPQALLGGTRPYQQFVLLDQLGVRALWKDGTKVQRSYRGEVVEKLDSLDDAVWDVVQYGALSHHPQRYPLYAVKSRDWQENHPYLLVTGGVHGYETSGVQGAILFMQKCKAYAKDVNILVAPCVSPWAYEHIQRWNAELKDPNRSFKKGAETEESGALMAYLESLGVKKWTCHLDLHETTNTDATEFMPAKHAEAGLAYEEEVIPDGFYLVGDCEKGALDFQEAVIASVEKVTHIAPADAEGTIIGEPMVREGIILVPATELGLCCSVTGGDYVTTTEVYPDSERATGEICNQAQVAAITGALDYVLSGQKK